MQSDEKTLDSFKLRVWRWQNVDCQKSKHTFSRRSIAEQLVEHLEQLAAEHIVDKLEHLVEHLVKDLAAEPEV